MRRLSTKDTPSRYVQQLSSVLTAPHKASIYPNAREGYVTLEIEEEHPDVGTFEQYCRDHNIPMDSDRWIIYSKAEKDDAPLLVMQDEAFHYTPEGTQYTAETACPKCGCGRTQVGPLVLPEKPTDRQMFCIHSGDDLAWVISSEIKEAFQGFTGFRLGPVCAAENPQRPLENRFQLIITNYLPRMATITEFVKQDPFIPCGCNRIGWVIQGGAWYYVRSALASAKDFNLTVERLSGTGCGWNWTIVSQAVRRVLLDHKLLKGPGCFEPIHVLDEDPGKAHKFDLPLDEAPGSTLDSPGSPGSDVESAK